MLEMCAPFRITMVQPMSTDETAATLYTDCIQLC